MKIPDSNFWIKLGIFAVCILVLLQGYNSFSFFAFLRQWTILGYIGLGLLLELLCGDLDLSFGAHVGAGALLFTYLLGRTGQGFALFGVVVFSLLLGLLRGMLIAVLRVPSLIITFALQVLIRGMASALSNSKYIYYSWDPFGIQKSYAWVCAAVLMICLAILLVVLLKKSYFGFYCRLIGENRDQLEKMDIPCGNILIASHTISGLFFAIAAVLLVLRANGASSTSGDGFLYQGILAACLGNVDLLGGRGSAHDILFGALAVVILNQLLTRYALMGSMENFVQGVVLLISLWRLSVQQNYLKQEIE